MRLGYSVLKFAAASALALGSAFAWGTNLRIDTTPTWNGTQFISSFGIPNTATYGQTVTAPGNARSMHDFTFQLASQSTTDSVIFRGLVFAWDPVNQRAVGSPLFTGPQMVLPANATPNVFVPFTVSTGNIPIVAGQQYVLMVTTSLDYANPSASARFAAVPDAGYGGGRFVFINNGGTTAQWTGNQWSNIALDLSFVTNFDVVDVPTLGGRELAILAALIAIAGFYASRRRIV